MHFDALHNLLAQIAGRKRVTLFPPSESFKLYPYAVGHARDNYSMVADPEHVDLSRFPAFAHACGFEGVLSPGDVLFLPRYIWHHVSQVPPFTSPSLVSLTSPPFPRLRHTDGRRD